MRRQVGDAVAGDDFVEQAEVIGDLLRKLGIRCRAQHDASAARVLGAYPFQQFGTVWQRGDVELNAIRDLALQLRLAFEQPEWQPPCQPRFVSEQAQR